MAGRGPAPAEKKRRQNKPPVFDELPAEGYAGDYPPLSASYGVNGDDGERVQVAYLPEAREWYETWARSPMAAKFTGVDWNRLLRLAALVDAYYRRPSKELAAEMRLQEGLFGGSPLDRLRAQMRIAKSDEQQEGQAPRAKSSASRRARLSVVPPPPESE